ncbi:MAG TPA: YabP/YqfC family sporulation protein [Firmicutes bacterium]|nr:YabP/YqfC family sporulation protein [Bacillota bacterium]
MKKIKSPAHLQKLLNQTLMRDAALSLSGNSEATVEGCSTISSYDENMILLSGKKLSFRFVGCGLELRSLNQESVVIRGKIESIELIEN